MACTEHPEYGVFDTMSTEALEEILRMDSYGAANETYRVDTMLYIMEVIARRKGGTEEERHARAARALQEFKEEYLPIGDGVSLYPDDGEDTAPDEETPHSPGRKRPALRSVLRRVILVAAVVAVLFGGMVTAQAAGLDIFGAIARWTDETFGFSVDEDTPVVKWEQEYQNALSEIGLDQTYLPIRLPDDFEAGELRVYQYDMIKELYLPLYSPYGQFIDVMLSEYDDINLLESAKYEKDYNPIREIVEDDRSIYIFQNLDNISIVCQKGNRICMVTGRADIDQDILLQIVDSIGVMQ